jgi:prepilin-type processing-associated H-X9-DG protein
MPALNKVKRLAQRLVCGTSVKGLGTAMMVYAQDFEDEYPIQGGSGQHPWSETGETGQWWNPDKSWSISRPITVSASLYLLVRVADVDPKSFVCRSGDETPFKGVSGTANLDLVELWDFGARAEVDRALPDGSGTVSYEDGRPKEHVSYAYQLPYDPIPGNPDVMARPASATSSASTAILADKNPWCDPKLTDAITYSDQASMKRDFMMLIAPLGAGEVDWDDTDDPLRNSTTAWQIQIANSQPHGREGQNVLFGDGHASFEKRPDISYQNDNIYTMWLEVAPPPTEYSRRTGQNRPTNNWDPMPPQPSYVYTDEDTLLVNDDSRNATLHFSDEL